MDTYIFYINLHINGVYYGVVNAVHSADFSSSFSGRSLQVDSTPKSLLHSYNYSPLLNWLNLNGLLEELDSMLDDYELVLLDPMKASSRVSFTDCLTDLVVILLRSSFLEFDGLITVSTGAVLMSWHDLSSNILD